MLDIIYKVSSNLSFRSKCIASQRDGQTHKLYLQISRIFFSTENPRSYYLYELYLHIVWDSLSFCSTPKSPWFYFTSHLFKVENKHSYRYAIKRASTYLSRDQLTSSRSNSLPTNSINLLLFLRTFTFLQNFCKFPSAQ